MVALLPNPLLESASQREVHGFKSSHFSSNPALKTGGSSYTGGGDQVVAVAGGGGGDRAGGEEEEDLEEEDGGDEPCARVLHGKVGLEGGE
ncbi:hypothetical protein RJ640_022905 [Escallonia rubra]|uniref:Uncharacterized protein n=1 Tax=Escallonia rubra TaxID=112253 RepID=A0AA88UG89_9ASTE|nr:hypothetical protein RJ640_022905 [Escallonia rubra]